MVLICRAGSKVIVVSVLLLLLVMIYQIGIVSAAQLITVDPFYAKLDPGQGVGKRIGAPTVVTIKITNIEPNGYSVTVVIRDLQTGYALFITQLYEGQSTSYYNKELKPLGFELFNHNPVTVEVWGELVRRWDP